MTQGTSATFFSYGRGDSDFALRLAGDLKAAGASVWLDQLDIVLGQRWDRAVEDALANCPRMLVILSPASVNSTNVMDEVSVALGEKKTVILLNDCSAPHYATDGVKNCHISRQCEIKRRASAGVRCSPETGTVRFHDGMADRQAHS